MSMSSSVEMTPEILYKTAWSTAIGLFNGPTLFAIVCLVWINRGEVRLASDMYDGLWALLALLAASGATAVWRRRVESCLPRSGTVAMEPDVSELQALTTGLVVTWWILDFASMAGILLYFVRQSLIGLAGGLAIVWIGVWLTRPRRAWYGLRPKRLS